MSAALRAATVFPTRLLFGVAILWLAYWLPLLATVAAAIALEQVREWSKTA